MIAQFRIGVIGITALLGLGLVGLTTGCLGPSSPSTPTRVPASALAPTLEPVLAELRDLGLAYWGTYNSYDLEALLAYLEPTYRDEQEGPLRDKIRLLKLFRVKLGVSVASEPEHTGPNVAQMYMRISEPLGSRQVLMRFQKDSRWMITYAQEVKEGQKVP